jgi:hypothetical protein
MLPHIDQLTPFEQGCVNYITQNDTLTIITEILRHSLRPSDAIFLSENLIGAIKLNDTSVTRLRNLIAVDKVLKCDFLNSYSAAITLSYQNEPYYFAR